MRWATGRSCHAGARTFVRVKLLEVVSSKGRLYPEVSARMRTMTALRQFGRTSLYHEAITSITYQQQHWHETCAPMGIGRAGQSVPGRLCRGYPSGERRHGKREGCS